MSPQEEATRNFHPPDASDAHLVAVYISDQEGPAGRQAVSQLLDRYRRLVLSWCARYVDDRESALDLAQEVLLNAFSKLDRYREQEKFSAWLFIITRNRCLSELRKRKVPLATEAVLELIADPADGPEVHLEEAQVKERWLEVVNCTLDRVEKDALWMRCFEGLSVEVITHQLHLEEAGGARTVLQRARRKLRKALLEKGGNGEDGKS